MESTKPSAGDNQPEPGSRSTSAGSGAGNEVVSAAPVQRMSPAVQPPASAPLNGPRKAEAPPEPVSTARRGTGRKWFILAALIFVLALSAYFFTPDIITALNTVSTDDAYVNGYVTFVAARVPGQVVSVLVDDDFRVKKGDLLVELDKTPYEVQVEIKKAALVTAQANLDAASAQARAEVGSARAARFALQHAIESVDTQVADLRAAVATYNSSQAALDLAKSNLNRAEALAPNGAVSQQDLDVRREELKVEAAAVEQSLQQVYAARAGLGLPTEPAQGKPLDDVPPNLDQNFSTVSQDLAALQQAVSQLGYRFVQWNGTPNEVIEQFLKLDAHGNINNIVNYLLTNAPVIKQAQANLLQAQSDLDQAQLNLSYCDVVSDIDGVVTGRNVNPGDNVATAQDLMAVRSLKEIWIDANFKETQ
ncbi:MAG: biotin/lipoyl-binding protein, partial [Tepidisphaeraceae bacterium]